MFRAPQRGNRGYIGFMKGCYCRQPFELRASLGMFRGSSKGIRAIIQGLRRDITSEH